MFEDDRFLSLGVKYARRSVSWDVTRDPRLTQELDEWLQGARKAEVEPLITFARSHREGRRRIQPTAEQYDREVRAFKRKWPWVRAFSTWNEVNLPGEGPASNPKLVGSYYRTLKRTFPTSKILAADLLDLPSMVTWVKRFQRVNKIQPKYWGLHNYVTANRFQVERTKRLLQATKGEVWITEVGGLVARRNRTLIKLPQGKAHAAQVTRFMFDKLARLDKRVARIYAYHWDSLEHPRHVGLGVHRARRQGAAGVRRLPSGAGPGPPRSLVVPQLAERLQQRRVRRRVGGGEVGLRQRRGDVPDVLEVAGAAVAAGHVGLETGALLGREGVVEVVGDELDELAARERVLASSTEAQAHQAFASSVVRTRARARCRSTRWLPGVRSSSSHTCSEGRPARSRRAMTAR